MPYVRHQPYMKQQSYSMMFLYLHCSKWNEDLVVRIRHPSTEQSVRALRSICQEKAPAGRQVLQLSATFPITKGQMLTAES